MIKIFLLSFALLSPAYAAIGDNAPSVPPTYVTSHPRLPYPDSTFLTNICNNGTATSPNDGCHMVSRYRTAADGWNSSAPGSRINMRYLLIAYLASKQSGTANATYLAKIQAFTYSSGACNLNGGWNLTTGNGYWDPALALALSYDWIYSDLGSNAQSCTRGFLYTMMSGFEANYTGASPYNDQFYLTGYKQMLHLIAALAIYPDDTANSLPHLRWSMDVFLNTMLPVWKQVIGANGYCGSSTDSSNDCGGGWHEPWNDYQGKTEALTQWYLPMMMSWATASGRGISNFFTIDQPWMKNFAYWLMYETRPDFVIEPIGDESRPYLNPEYTGSIGADLGYLDGLAAIYNDPTLRGWSRLMNWHGAAPDGYEPSAWPYYAPDSSANSTNSRSVLSTTRNFPGWGTIFFRTGWTENDTFCTLRYGDSFWSHPVQDTGAFTCFNRGPLAIRSGDYRSGSASPHYTYYAAQAIAQNVPLVYDPNDVYNAEIVGACGPANQACNGGSNPDYNDPMPNDGGQRRVGSAMGNYTGTVPSQSIGGLQASPSDIAQWNRAREYYHLGKLVAYSTGSNNKYSFAAVDMTAAYNNLWSRNVYNSANTWVYNTANTSNRSFRVRKAVRQFLFIPRGTAAYVVVYDQIVSTNPSFTKKDLIHSINQPMLSGNSYSIARTETVTSKPFANLWPQQWSSYISDCPSGCTSSSTQYQYNGKLYGWMTIPSTGSLTNVGGAGAEFQITDANGTHNWNQCMYTQCSYGSIAGSVAGPFNITSSNNTLLVSIDGGSAQTVTLTQGSARTTAQVVSDVNTTLTGAAASVQGDGNGFVAIKSNSTVPGTASVKFSTVTNSAYATLGFTAGTYTGDNYDEGLGAIGDYMHPVNTTGPAQLGSWRIEETVGANNLTDQFINVMLVTSASDTNTVSTAPATTVSGTNYVTTWQDKSNTCTYTVIQPTDGVGATLSVQGAGCATVIN